MNTILRERFGKWGWVWEELGMNKNKNTLSEILNELLKIIFILKNIIGKMPKRLKYLDVGLVSRYLYSSSLLCISPVPGNSMPISDLCAQTVHIYA